jgi:predicted secreted protein
MTNAKTGAVALFKIGANAVAEWTSIKLKADRKMIEVTSKDSALFDEFIAGHKNWTMDVEGNWIPGDTNGQLALENAWANDTLLANCTVQNDTGGANWKGSAFVKSVNIDIAVKDQQKASFSLQGTSTITRAAS